jgi:hypothetical protein
LDFDIKNDSSFDNNFRAVISYNNFDHDTLKNKMYTSFHDFLKYCKKEIYINDLPRKIVYYDGLDFFVKNNTFYFKFPKNYKHDTLHIDNKLKWCVKTTFNNPKKESSDLINKDFYSPTPDNFKK